MLLGPHRKCYSNQAFARSLEGSLHNNHRSIQGLNEWLHRQESVWTWLVSKFTSRLSDTYKSKDLTSMTAPPSSCGASLTLLTPCMTPVCCSPDTSITSRVKSSQGIFGKVIFRCISIFSPTSKVSADVSHYDSIFSLRPLSTINSGCTTIRRYSAHSPQASHRTISNEAIVTIPPEVVRTLASSTVLVKASSLVNLDFAGMLRTSWGMQSTGNYCK